MTGVFGNTINVDVSQALTVCNELKKNLSPEVFEKCLKYTIMDTGNRCIRKVVKKEVVKEYAVTSSWVNGKIKAAQMIGGGMGCVVPIKGERGSIGGIFSAGGGGRTKGRARVDRSTGELMARKKTKKQGAKITAKILRGSASVLPSAMSHQGGQPPFRMPSGIVVTRKTSQAYPLARVVGRAVPQMTEKLFDRSIEEQINEYMIQRMNENVARFMKI